MPSTYTPNNGIEIIATGEQSGTWGDTTNTNLELIDVALDGQLIKTLAVPGISSSPNALAITDGDQSDGRNRLIVFTDGGDLGSTAYVQLTPNDAEKIIYVRNDLAGGRSIIFFQGTYNASNDFELPAGKDAIVKFNGGGSGAITSAVFEDLYLANATVGTLVNTNLQVSNIAALDGTSAGSIADSTGVVTLASSVLTTADINGGTLDNVTIGGDTPAAATFTTATATNVQVTNIKANDGTSAVTIADSTGVVTIPSVVSTNVQVTNIKANDGTSAMTIADSTGIVTFAAGTTGTTQTLTTIEVTNINAHDGTTSATIADATGVMTIASSVLTTTDINGGTIDGATIATSDITVGAGKTLDVSAGTLTLADDQISGDKIQGGTIGSTTITTLTGTTGNITNVNATTVDATNIEVTNIKAKDGTASATIADATGVMTVASSVLTTTDINGGTIDGVTIGSAVAGAGTFTSVTGTSLDMNGLADFGGNIGLSRAASTILYRTDDTGVVDIRSATASLSGSSIQLCMVLHTQHPLIIAFLRATACSSALLTDSPEFMRFVDGTGAVFNEEGADHDFRIESDTNANAFFLQGSNGYVGISTASPLQPLHVNSSGNTQLLVSSSFNNSTNTGLTVDTVGDSSAFRLNVTKSGAVQGTFRYLHAATSADQAWEFAASGSVVYKAGYAEHIWKTGNTERLRINSSGNVGIGTVSPAQKLDVNGTIKGTGFSTASTTNPITYMDQNVVWSPTFVSSGGGETISYTVNSGQYCRYGEWVTCAGRIVVASVSGGSGSTYIGGLPFTTVNSSIAQGTLQVGTSIGFVTKSPEMGGTLQNTVTCLLKYFDGSQAASFSWSEIQAGSTLFFTIIYRAA
jgi:trimeric autotransporter adhesin